MAAQGREVMAQAVLMAQIAASDGKCTCKACRCLRRAGTALVDEFLAGPTMDASAGVGKIIDAATGQPEGT